MGCGEEMRRGKPRMRSPSNHLIFGTRSCCLHVKIQNININISTGCILNSTADSTGTGTGTPLLITTANNPGPWSAK